MACQPTPQESSQKRSDLSFDIFVDWRVPPSLGVSKTVPSVGLVVEAKEPFRLIEVELLRRNLPFQAEEGLRPARLDERIGDESVAIDHQQVLADFEASA